MSLRALAALPLGAGILVLLAFALLAPDQRWPVIDALVRGGKVLALFGCLVGGLSFRRGEHLRRGWLLLATTYGLLVVRDGVLHRNLLLDIDDPRARWAELVVVALANLSGVLAAWNLARAWLVAGVELPGTPATRGVVRGAAVVMALSITMPSFTVHVPALVTGSPQAILGVAAALGDAVSLALLAPVLLTALGLRGTPAVWPWALLATSMFGWLCFDAIFSVSALVSGTGQALRAVADAFRMLSVVAAGCAGIAQGLVAAHGDSR